MYTLKELNILKPIQKCFLQYSLTFSKNLILTFEGNALYYSESNKNEKFRKRNLEYCKFVLNTK